MASTTEIKLFKANTILDVVEKNSLYCLKSPSESEFRIVVTDRDGNPINQKDNSGSGAVNLTSLDGSISITGTTTKNLQLATFLQTLINSALQSGDNISELFNDANYITLADIPNFNPLDYDLDDFNNSSADPYARVSQIISGSGISSVVEGDRVSIDNTDPLNPIISADLQSTNLGYTASPTNGVVTSDTGTDSTIPLADATNAGLLTPLEKTKIASAIQPTDLADVATTGDYEDLINTPTNLSDLTNDIVYENVVKTLGKNPDGQFSFPHGTLQVGNKFYIGTREGATSKLLRYNELTLEESITIPCTSTIGLESLCTDGTRLYGIRHNASTSYIFDCDLEDFTDIQYNTITGVDLLGSPAIVTDGTYIYGVENTTPACNFFKIQISDWTTADTNAWGGVGGGHGGKINVADGVAYFSSQLGYFAKLALSDLTYSQLDLREYLSIITDDLAFCPASNNSAFINYVIVGGEYRDNTTGKGGVLIDTDAMTIVEFDLLPTYGLFFNNDYTKLYNVSNVGFIEEIDFESFIFNAQYNQTYTRNTYTFRQGGVPNEMFFNTSNEPYCTNWKSGGNLFKIELTPFTLPLITEQESYYRGLISVPTTLAELSGDSTHRVVTDANITNWDSKISEAPNDVNAYVRSALGWVVGYAKSAIDTLLGNKVDKNTTITGATKTKITYDSKGLVVSGTDATLSDFGLNFTPYKFIQASQTPHTGTIAKTIIATATILGGTFPTIESLKFLFGINKPSTTSAYTLRCDINTTNTISGATTIATFTGSATAQVAVMTRNFSLLGGNLYGYPFTTSQLSDSAALLAGTLGSTAFDTTNTIYMFWTIQLVNSADSVTPNLTTLKN